MIADIMNTNILESGFCLKHDLNQNKDGTRSKLNSSPILIKTKKKQIKVWYSRTLNGSLNFIKTSSRIFTFTLFYCKGGFLQNSHMIQKQRNKKRPEKEWRQLKKQKKTKQRSSTGKTYRGLWWRCSQQNRNKTATWSTKW